MMEALLTLLPTPIMFPPITSVVPSELAIDCGVDIVSEDRPLCVPCPVVCPCGFAAFELPPLLNDEFPNDEFPNEELPNDDPFDELLPPAGCEPPNKEPNPPLLPEELELCPSGPSVRLFRLPINCPFGPT